MATTTVNLTNVAPKDTADAHYADTSNPHSVVYSQLGNADEIQFNPVAAPAYSRGKIYYDQNSEALSVYDDISGTSIQVGQEIIIRARNNSGSTINDMEVVYVTGAIGQNPTIELAQANAASTARTIGLATHDIANNTIGKVCTFGVVRNIDTSPFNDGDLLWMSATVAGGLVATPPTAPDYSIFIGVVLHAHATQGKILVDTEKNVNIGLGTANQYKVMNAAGTEEAWITPAILHTIELIDELTTDYYAPFDMSIDSVTDLVNSPTTTIQVNAAAYTLGNSISAGDKITVTVDVAAVVQFNVTEL